MATISAKVSKTVTVTLTLESREAAELIDVITQAHAAVGTNTWRADPGLLLDLRHEIETAFG